MQVCRMLNLGSIVFLSFSVGLSQTAIENGYLRAILKTQNFSGVVSSEATFKELGQFACGPDKIDAIFYSWEERRNPGIAKHAQYRLIFMRGIDYIGSFVVKDEPTAIRTNAIRFGYLPSQGNEIHCEKTGLPSTALLDGDQATLFK